jgi:ABC-type branched-subunit amino acid transport system permease subunit
MSPANSIEMVIWAAVGGRGTLLGPIIGAFTVNGLKSWFTGAFPDSVAVCAGSDLHPGDAATCRRA